MAGLMKLVVDEVPLGSRPGTKPSHWWNACATLGYVPRGLADFACMLLESAASSAGLERCFSTTKWVQSTLRNGLCIEKVKMLTFCARLLRGQHE